MTVPRGHQWENRLRRPIQLEIYGLAWPNIISNISVPLISSVDTYLMGQLSTTAMAAVGLGAMVFNFLYWNMGFLRMGTTGLTAQAYGAERHEDQVSILLRAGLWAIGVALVFFIAQAPLYRLSAWAMHIDDSLQDVAIYYQIRMYAAPAVLLNMVLMGWSFGMQNARYPLYVTLVINVVNMGLSYYLVVDRQMGVTGAACGSVVAQYTGIICLVTLLYSRYNKLWSHHRPVWASIRSGMMRFLRINVDLFIRTLCLSVSFVLVLRYSQQLGLDIVAINLVIMQGLHWVSYAVDGFAYAAESMVGKYKGLDDDDAMQTTIRWCMIFGAVLAIIFSVGFATGVDRFFKLFMDSDYERVRPMAQVYYPWLAVLPLAGWASYIWDGIFVGLTAVRSMRDAMLCSFALFLLSYYLLPASMANHRIWLSFVIFLLSRAALQWYLMNRHGWRGLN